MGIQKKFDDSSLVDRLVEALRDLIITGTLEPGSHIGIRKIADSYGVSMIPVREALARLLPSRLVRVENNRGYFVADRPDASEYQQFVEARELFEIAVVTVGFENATVTDIKKLRNLNSQMRKVAESRRSDRMARWSRLNGAFHQTLVDLARNAYLSNQYSDLSLGNMHTQLVQSFQKDPVSLERLVNQHDQLIDALELGNRTKFLTLLSQHIRNVIPRAKF